MGGGIALSGCVLMGGTTNSVEWISCRCLCMVIFTLCIHEYSVIRGIVQQKFKQIFQFQFYKEHYTVCYCVLMQGEVGGRVSRRSGLWLSCWSRYLSYACSALDTNI